MESLGFFFTIAGIHLLAVASPGPDFFLVLKNSFSGGRQAGIYTSLGIMIGVAVHLTYCLAGVAVLIQETPTLFLVLKLMGGAYLSYLGIRILLTPSTPPRNPLDHQQGTPTGGAGRTSAITAIRQGFLCNILNPKATLFFWSLFVGLITPEIPIWLQIACAGEMLAANFLWFSFVAFLVAHPALQRRLRHAQHWLERLTGLALLIVGVRLAFATVQR